MSGNNISDEFEGNSNSSYTLLLFTAILIGQLPGNTVANLEYIYKIFKHFALSFIA